jgi:hypothetical protein
MMRDANQGLRAEFYDGSPVPWCIGFRDYIFQHIDHGDQRVGAEQQSPDISDCKMGRKTIMRAPTSSFAISFS